MTCGRRPRPIRDASRRRPPFGRGVRLGSDLRCGLSGLDLWLAQPGRGCRGARRGSGRRLPRRSRVPLLHARAVDSLGVAGARCVRSRGPAPVRLARVRAGRRAADPAPTQLRGPAAALDLRAVPGVRSELLAREPDPDPGSAALPAGRRPAHGGVRSARREAGDRPAGDGPRRVRARGARPSPLGRSLRRGGFSVRLWPRRLGSASRAEPGGRRRAGRVEEPVPGAVRAAARLPARPARRPRAALELARAAAARRARAAPGVDERAALGRPAARPSPHVRIRLGDLRRVGDRDRALARRAARPRRRARSRPRGPCCR